MKPELSPEQRSEVVYALLKVGVPPSAIARALEMDVDHVRGALNHMRVEAYGTDEISEAMTHLIWCGYEEALHQIRYGAPKEKSRFIQLVLARSVALAGRADTDASEKIRSALMALSAEQRTPNVLLGDSIYTPLPDDAPES